MLRMRAYYRKYFAYAALPTPLLLAALRDTARGPWSEMPHAERDLLLRVCKRPGVWVRVLNVAYAERRTLPRVRYRHAHCGYAATHAVVVNFSRAAMHASSQRRASVFPGGVVLRLRVLADVLLVRERNPVAESAGGAWDVVLRLGAGRVPVSAHIEMY